MGAPFQSDGSKLRFGPSGDGTTFKANYSRKNIMLFIGSKLNRDNLTCLWVNTRPGFGLKGKTRNGIINFLKFIQHIIRLSHFKWNGEYFLSCYVLKRKQDGCFSYSERSGAGTKTRLFPHFPNLYVLYVQTAAHLFSSQKCCVCLSL